VSTSSVDPVPLIVKTTFFNYLLTDKQKAGLYGNDFQSANKISFVSISTISAKY